MAKKEIGRQQKRDLAFDLYLNTDKSQKEICEIVGWTEKTFSENKDKGNWEELKGAETITSRKIIANLYQQLHDLSDKPIVHADKIIKLANAIEKLSGKKVTLSNSINVFKDFTIYAFGIDAELAKKINQLQNQYIQYKANNG